MAIVPAICDRCGTVFSSGMAFDGPSVFSLKGGKSGPCPRCGGMGTIPDGTYEVVGNALRTLLTAAQSPDALRRVSSILQNAQREQAHASTLADQVEDQAPELSVFADWIRQYLVPKNAGEVVGYLSLIIASVAFVLQVMSMQQQPAQFDEKAVSDIVEKAVGAALAQTAKQAKMKSGKNGAGTQKVKKVGRNDSCPCHSGKKFKLCCINNTAYKKQ